jgi:hypothetical protein
MLSMNKNPTTETKRLRRLYVILSACGIALCVGGCGVNNLSVDRPVGKAIDGVETGQTHYKDVLDRLGPPAKISAMPGGGMVFLYEHVETTQRQLAFDLAWIVSSGPARLVRLAVARGEGNLETAMFEFDEHGSLRAATMNLRQQDFGISAGVGLVGLPVKLGKDQVFMQPAPQHDWGMSMLRPLPRTLNAGQDLDAGTNGLELRGVSQKTGQRTLEMKPIPLTRDWKF